MSRAEENYIKAIFTLSERKGIPVATSAIAKLLETSAPSVSDMLKKLADKGLIAYEKYKGVRLSKDGIALGTSLVRKHRLWETFLVIKLGYTWDEVHDIAEELEHIPFDDLVDRLDAFLDFPRFDPHGDPIPDKNGKFTIRHQTLLSQVEVGQTAVVLGVQKHSKAFLQFLNSLKIRIGQEVTIEDRQAFDGSIKVLIEDKMQLLTAEAADHILVNVK